MSKYIKEGESVPLGYGFVAHRYDMLAKEVAIIPVNYILRFVRWLQFKSYRQMTKDELRQLRRVKNIVKEAVIDAQEEERKKNFRWFKDILAGGLETSDDN